MRHRYLLLQVLFTCVLLLTACLPVATSAPAPPLHHPLLVPGQESTVGARAAPQRILIIGNLFAEDVDSFLKGLVQAANPTAQLEVASIILPAT